MSFPDQGILAVLQRDFENYFLTSAASYDNSTPLRGKEVDKLA